MNRIFVMMMFQSGWAAIAMERFANLASQVMEGQSSVMVEEEQVE